MAQGGGGCLCKCILFIYVAVFALIGFATLWLGLSLRLSDKTTTFFENKGSNSSGFATGVEAMILLGLVLVVGVWIGKKGICNDNKMALEWFAVLLACLAATAFAAGDFAYSRSDEAAKFLIEFYAGAYMVYVFSGDQAVGTALTFIQDAFHCCGLTGVPIIELVKRTCPEPVDLSEILSMPSCPVHIGEIFETQASMVKDDFEATGTLLIGALICSLYLIMQR